MILGAVKVSEDFFSDDFYGDFAAVLVFDRSGVRAMARRPPRCSFSWRADSGDSLHVVEKKLTFGLGPGDTG